MARYKKTAAADMEIHWCSCGVQAVDRYKGEYLCRECLMGPDEQPEPSVLPSSAGDIMTKRERLDSMVINKAITKFMQKHGIRTGEWTSDKLRF